jgi:hypothetical protein
MKEFPFNITILSRGWCFAANLTPVIVSFAPCGSRSQGAGRTVTEHVGAQERVELRQQPVDMARVVASIDRLVEVHHGIEPGDAASRALSTCSVKAANGAALSASQRLPLLAVVVDAEFSET